MTSKGILRRRWSWAAIIAVLAAIVVALNWNWLMLTGAIATAERRPALLSDAEWNKPDTAHAFKNRFPLGTSESQLVSWLESNNFEVKRAAGKAKRLVRSLPCNEFIQVTWTTSPANEIANVEVRVSEAGCL
jgi:hypothetical protein